MSEFFLSWSAIVVGILIIGLGVWSFKHNNSAAYKRAGVKVDFTKTAASNGFAPGLINTAIVVFGAISILYGVVLLID